MSFSTLKKTLPILLLLLIKTEAVADNVIIIDQIGDRFTATIDVQGSNQQIKGVTTTSKIDGDDVEIKVLTGTSSTSNNLVKLEIDGNNNTAIVLQDRTDMGNDDTIAYGYHTSSIKLVGTNNYAKTIQRNNGTNATQGHTSSIDVLGNYATVNVKQISDYGKTASVDIDANNVTVDIFQQGHGNHTITLDVDNAGSTFDLDQGYNPGTSGHSMNIATSGAYPSTVTVSQQSNTQQTYSLTQNCQTVGGCSVSVTQGQ
jgi:predicted RNA-binding protein